MSSRAGQLPPELQRQPPRLPEGARNATVARKSLGSSSRARGDAVVQQGGLLKRFPDGRFCKLCNCQDTGRNPLEGEPVFMWWGYPPGKTGA